ncbi:MAG: excinuclease ABC subunit UvrC [Candidatus Hodarchaeales archaeon]
MKDMAPKSILFKNVLDNLPLQPGVYFFKDSSGRVMYIGAASNLKKRINSYFRKDLMDSKTKKVVSKINSIDYEIHSTKEAAFLRERELIRIYNPQYNIDWKDDKEYPMIRITKVDDIEKFSRIFIVRSVTKKDDWYFSRKKDVKALRYSIRILRSIFPIADKSYCFRVKKPCLDYSIKRCSAPCVGKISLSKYQKIVNQFILFLTGKKSDLIDDLISEMNYASDNLEFEKAAMIRDKIARIESILESDIDFHQSREQDYVTLLEENSYFLLLVFWVTNEKVINLESRYLGYLEHLDRKEIVNAFLQKYYIEGGYIPETIELDTDLEENFEKIKIWLSKKRGGTIKLKVNPKFRDLPLFRSHIMRHKLELAEQSIQTQKRRFFPQNALLELKEYLHLNQVPHRIEGYDISNIQGHLPVGSMIVFENGVSKKSEYRRFKIKTFLEKPNDVGMLKEVIERRMRHISDTFSKKLPDLLVIDGGKPQVNAVYKVLKKINVDIPVIGLAKKEEMVFLPRKKDPLNIPKDSQGLQLLKQCRDEAHRFALSYHRKRRLTLPKTKLDQIPGVGIKRRNALLNHFKNVEEIKKASIEELCEVDAINRKLAEKIYLYFRTEK